VKFVLDTNVLISGLFFPGLPHRILCAWRDGKLELVLSPEILDEYRRVAEEFSGRSPEPDVEPFLRLLGTRATVVSSPTLPEQVCTDPDDDKFLACALAARAKVITSGDKHLLAVSGYHGVEVLRPRAFVEKYLRKRT
jgi:putative PIN family toxin of toxin-antitoxin system